MKASIRRMKFGSDPNYAIRELVELANRVRCRGRLSDADATRGIDAEAQLERSYRHSQRLAVYGSLAPGRSNHHIVAPYGGTWARGRVRGDLVEAGWGAVVGYPALRMRADGPWVPVHLLDSDQLPGAWPAIDAFEGDEYQRILVPVFADRDDATEVIAVANLYEIV